MDRNDPIPATLALADLERRAIAVEEKVVAPQGADLRHPQAGTPAQQSGTAARADSERQ